MSASPELTAEQRAALRGLPKVDDVLARPELRGLLRRFPRWALVAELRDTIDRARRLILEGGGALVAEGLLDPALLERQVALRVRPSLLPVLNATGVVLHTNLGRAPLAPSAVDRIVSVASGWCNLEYELDARRRGSRQDHVRGLLSQVTGAEDGIAVNNCAAAVLLALGAHGAGRRAIVSRGELVEIGGSFRVPDVMAASGVTLVEVGTTNRTHLADYERALEAHPDALLVKIHQSNFAQVGFTAEVDVAALAKLARARGATLIVDAGTGALVPLAPLGLEGADDDWVIPRLVEAGPDLVLFSADKLLGGPQAGLLVGSARAIAPCRTHPLHRAVRPSKLALAGLEATLELYRDGRSAELPAVSLLVVDEATLKARAERLLLLLGRSLEVFRPTARRVRSAVGGGAMPLVEPWSWAIALEGPVELLDAALRAGSPPIVGRIAEERLLLDVRTLADAALPLVADGLLHAAEELFVA